MNKYKILFYFRIFNFLISFLITTALSIFQISCYRNLDSIRTPDLKLNVKLDLSLQSSISSEEIEADSVFQSFIDKGSLISMQFYVHRLHDETHDEKPIERIFTFDIGEKPIDNEFTFSLSDLPQSGEDILIQYLGVFQSTVGRNLMAYTYGEVETQLTESTQDVEITARLGQSFPKYVHIGGRFIEENLNLANRSLAISESSESEVENLTGKISVFFHPPKNGRSDHSRLKIPVYGYEPEIFDGWFQLTVATIESDLYQPSDLLFSFNLKESNEPLFSLIKGDPVELNTTRVFEGVRWSKKRFSYEKPFEVLNLSDGDESEAEELDEIKQVFLQPPADYIFGFFNNILNNPESTEREDDVAVEEESRKICLDLREEDVFSKSFKGDSLFSPSLPIKKTTLLSEASTNEDSLEVSESNEINSENICEASNDEGIEENLQIEYKNSGHYLSRVFKFNGLFKAIDLDDFYQPFVKAKFLERLNSSEPSDKIRIEWAYLQGVDTLIDGVKIFAKNEVQTENTLKPKTADLFLSQKGSLLDYYAPDENLSFSCSELQSKGWTLVSSVGEGKTQYDFDDDQKLNLKERENRQIAENWNFILCPYKDINNEMTYYSSSAIRKLRMNKKFQSFEAINSFGEKSEEEVSNNIMIENENVFISDPSIKGAFGRVKSIEKIEESESVLDHKSLFRIHLSDSNQSWNFNKGDEVLLHISYANSLNSCGKFLYEPILPGFWTLASIQNSDSNNSTISIKNESFINSITNENLNLPMNDSSLCYVQAVKVIQFGDLSIINGSLKARAFDPLSGGGIIAIRVNGKLFLDNGKIDANFLGYKKEASSTWDYFFGDRSNEDRNLHSSVLSEEKSLYSQILVEEHFPLLFFGNAKKGYLQDQEHQEKRGGGIIFLASRRIILSNPLEISKSTLEAKGEERGFSGSIYVLTKGVSSKDEYNEEKTASQDQQLQETPYITPFPVVRASPFLFLNLTGGQGLAYVSSCDGERILPFGEENEMSEDMTVRQTYYDTFMQKMSNGNNIKFVSFPTPSDESQRILEEEEIDINKGFLKFQNLFCK